MTYSIYDRELNEFTPAHWTQDDKWLCEFVKQIAENEPDRAAFYEFEDESGNKFNCWDISRKFNLEVF